MCVVICNYALMRVVVIEKMCLSAGVDVGRGITYKSALKTEGTPRGASGGLSRSHSSPNIAKMVEDEVAAMAASSQLPRQQPPDRSTKPQMKYAWHCV